ncbi:MAG: CatB-related O-acetyltransferase, partial [Proteobacteria bacterium]
MKHRLISGRITPAFLDVLSQNEIYLEKNGGVRMLPGEAISFRTDAVIGGYSLISAGRRLFTIGSFSYSGSSLPTDFACGNYCSIAGNVSVMGTRHPIERISTSPFTYQASTAMFKRPLEVMGVEPFHLRSDWLPSAPKVGHDVWIGSDALLATGISIGSGAVVGARAVVTKDVEPFSIVAGMPARIIKMRFSDQIVERIQALNWWHFPFPMFSGVRLQ